MWLLRHSCHIAIVRQMFITHNLHAAGLAYVCGKMKVLKQILCDDFCVGDKLSYKTLRCAKKIILGWNVLEIQLLITD